MSGPKHLWSGDWERESRPPAAPPPHVPRQPEQAPPPPQPSKRPAISRLQLVIALGAGVAAAAATVALAITLGGSPNPSAHRQHATASTPASPTNPRTATGSGGQGLTTPAPACAPGSSACTTTTPVTGTAPLVTGPTATWLGMQIVTSPSGVVVNTVKLGSPADLAGVDPGDQIESVDGHPIGTVAELRPDTGNVRIGTDVTIGVIRSSVQLSLASMMTQRPTIHP